MKIWRGKSPSRKDDYYAAPDAKDWEELTVAIIDLQNVGDIDEIYQQHPLGSPVVFDGELASIDNPFVVGLVAEKGKYITSGKIELNDWSEITGYKHLEPGKIYYLSMYSPGTLTTIPPNFGALVEVGTTMSKNRFNINIKRPIFLE